MRIKKRIAALLMAGAMICSTLPVNALAAEAAKQQEQFAGTLTPGSTYWFDLSGTEIPGTKNDKLPDGTLHWVPFTYAGTVNAYKLESAQATTEDYAKENAYDHSLFIADYNVTHSVSWNQLNDKKMIFGKDYQSGGMSYTLRAPSVGSDYIDTDTGTVEGKRGKPQSNEWDKILDKDSGNIKNWSGINSWGQDTYINHQSYPAVRGSWSARFWRGGKASDSDSDYGFRPVLEIPNTSTLGSDGLKVVTLDLGGGKLGNSSEDIQIIVKTGESFTAPVPDGLSRPQGNTDNFFMWLGSDGNLYAPSGSVPADVTKLTVQWTAPTYTVTLNTNGGTIADEKNVTRYTYGEGATLPTADDMTYTGHTFIGWYDNEGLTGEPVTAIGDTEKDDKKYWAKWKQNSSGGGGSSGGGSYYPYTPSTPSKPAAPGLDKTKTDSTTALNAAATANKYDAAEQAEVKKILDKANADIKNAKTEAEVKAIEEAAQAEIDKILTTEEKAIVAALDNVEKRDFKIKSKVITRKGGKKVIRLTWTAQDGVDVDGYEIFRSTKKNSGFGKKPYFTTSNTSYTNTKDLKAGKTYYYKVRAFVVINGERVYTDYSLKAFRTIK